MKIKKLKFISRTQDLGDLPKPNRPEYAFIGRSNVGKSSLINLLTWRKNIAQTSKSPGKTQTINHFLVNDYWYLVDLPGYGFAKVPDHEKKKWYEIIREYLLGRANLQCVFMLVDISIPPQAKDIDFINQLGEQEIPYALVYTKADKVKQQQRQQNIQEFEQELLQYWEFLPQTFVTSAKKRQGRGEILSYIEEINKAFEAPIS